MRPNKHQTEFKVEIGLSDGFYITENTNIPGLVLESNSLDDLKEALFDVVPELLESNLGISRSELCQVIVSVYFPFLNQVASNKPRFLLEQEPIPVNA